MEIANSSSENAAQFRYLGVMVTDQNLIQVEAEIRLNLGNAFYQSVQNISCLNMQKLE
jgi:hypothetical protein